MLRDEPYDEFKTVVQYPPRPLWPWRRDPMVVAQAGEGSGGRATADRFAARYRAGGAEATVYRRTWTPGPWVAVDGTDVTELPDHCDDGHPHVPLLTSAPAVDPTELTDG